MEHINDIVSEIRTRLPDVRIRVEKTEGSRGPVWVDVSNGKSGLAIEWRQGMAYGVTSLPSDAIGTASDETYESTSELVDRVEHLLNKGLRTQPPQEAALKRLREHRRVSQDELAKRLGVGQPSVSRMEHRLDMNISTLRSVVEAIGGTLEIVARFVDETVRITQFDDRTPESSKKHVKRRPPAPLHITSGHLAVVQDERAPSTPTLSDHATGHSIFASKPAIKPPGQSDALQAPKSNMQRKDKKKRRRNLKPDEVMRFGPVTIARFGRLTEQSVDWDPKEHAKMLAALPARREALRGKIAAAVARAVGVIERCDPLPLVHGLFWKNCLVDIEAYSEPENDKSEAIVEFAHNLVAAVTNYGISKATEEDTDAFESACQEVLEAATLYFMTQPSSLDSDIAVEETRFLGMMRHIHIRGSSMIEHETDLLQAVFVPHDPFFRRHGFPSTNEFIKFCDDVQKRVNEFAQEQLTSAMQWAKYHQRYVEATNDPRVDAAQELERIKEEMAADTTSNLRAIGKDPLEPHIVPQTPSSEPFCRALSLGPGGNEGFLTFKKSPGWPTNDTETTTKPLLTVNGTTYALNPVSLLRNRAAILNDYIQRTDPTYYKDRFASVRGKVTEDLALRHLKLALPRAEVFASVYYSMEVDGELRRFEADGVVVLDEYLFLLEMKSGPFSQAAMRGAPKRMVEDLDHLVAEPYKQALRTLRYLRANPSARLENEGGQILTFIDLSSIRRTYIINVTLADISHVSARLNSARAMGLVEETVWPWSVHVNDLRVISELVQSPAEFLLYLDRRLALNNMRAISTIDELDYFGMFLTEGLYFEPDDVAHLDRFTPLGYTVPIDRYYDFTFGRVSSGAKPSLKISQWYRTLIDLIQARSSVGRYHVAQLLLSLDGEEQKKIERWFNDFGPSGHLEPRSVTLLSKKLPTLVLSVSAPSAPQHDQLMEGYAQKKRHQTTGRPLVWVAIAQDFSSATSRVFEGPIQEPTEVERGQLDVLRKSKYDAHVRAHGQPGRNDSCPCASNEKFKRCCLQFVDSWNARKKK